MYSCISLPTFYTVHCPLLLFCVSSIKVSSLLCLDYTEKYNDTLITKEEFDSQMGPQMILQQMIWVQICGRRHCGRRPCGRRPCGRRQCGPIDTADSISSEHCDNLRNVHL